MEHKPFSVRPKPTMQGQQEDQMRKSGGMQNSQRMRQTGQGFSRPGSREKDLSPFSIFNTTLDEMTYGIQMKADLMQLQEDIEQLDYDGKLRNTSGMDFMKPYQTAMKKYLQKNSDSNIKIQLDKISNNNPEIQQILDQLQVKSADEGLKKLYKLCAYFDFQCRKFTEYEILFLLRFEETFNQQTKNFPVQNTKLNLIQGGLSINKFQVPLCNLERFQDIFTVCNKTQQDQMSRTGGFSQMGLDAPQINLGNVKNRNDLIKTLDKSSSIQKDLKDLMIQYLREGNSLEEDLKTQQAVKDGSSGVDERVKQLEHIRKQLEKDNASLINKFEVQQTAITALQKQNKDQDAMIRELRNITSDMKQDKEQDSRPSQPIIGKKPPLHKDDPEYWTELIDDVKESFDKKTQVLTNENANLKDKILEKNITIEKYAQEISDLKDDLLDFQNWKKDLMSQWHQKFENEKSYQASYERALLLEFERYKKGFERKIESMKYEIDYLKREKGKAIYEIRTKLEREEETKRLLIKKLSAYIQ